MGAFRKEVLRSITHSWGRFLAIAVMAALGCGFYAGLRMTGPDMRLAGDEYYDATELCDLRVVSSLGMSDEQVDMLRGVEGVSGVMPAYEADAISQLAGVQYTLRYHSLDVDAAKASSCDDGMHVRSDDDDYVNRPILVEGSWPESDDECLLSVDNVWTSPVHIGDTVELLEGTQDLDGVFTTRTFTVAGFVRSSYYTCATNTGATSLGSGELSSFVFVPEGAFAADYPYTEAFLTVDGAAGEAWPDSAYQERVDAHHGQVLDGDGVAAHVTRQAHALEHAGRRGAHAHRTGSAVEVSTMAARTAGKAVALHDAGEALTLGGTGDVDLLDLGESRHGLLVAGLVLGGVLDAHLA